MTDQVPPTVPEDVASLAFDGVVILKDWMARPGMNGSYRLIVGRVEIIHQDKLVGFHVKGSESNWVARINGPTEAVTVLGCQIRGFIERSIEGTESVEAWVVQ